MAMQATVCTGGATRAARNVGDRAGLLVIVGRREPPHLLAHG